MTLLPSTSHSRFEMHSWREQYNPLRGLTLARAVSLLEAGERGDYPQLQWLYRAVEKRNPTLRAVRHRRIAALTRLDWTIKAAPGESSALAARQQDFLRAAYDRIDNLREAIGFLGLAQFRGYAHLEKHRDESGHLVHLAPVPQWFWLRAPEENGAWYYSPGGRSQPVRTGEHIAIDPADFVIAEVEDPINEIALIAHLRQNLSQKDWDGFVENYGIPPLFLELPPDVPADRQALYQAEAERIIGDARGTLPNGARIHTIDSGARDANPFRDHIRYQDECIVMAATSGKLTMLTESGSGTLAGGAHEATFADLARAEAMTISELCQAQIDLPVLAAAFPGEPVAAYFELEATPVDPAVIENAARLAEAGYLIDEKELSERLGFRIYRP